MARDLELGAELLIAAPPDAVWAALTDFARYAEWCPTLRSVRGRAEPGAELVLRLEAGPLQLPAHARVVDCVESRRLAWRGGRPGLAVAVHWFELEASGSGTLLRHRERFEGLLPTLMWPLLRRSLAPRYDRFNRALRARVESGARRSSS